MKKEMTCFRSGMLAAMVSVWLAAPSTASAEESAIDVVMETDRGAITLALYPDRAPVTVANFLKYVDGRLYDGGTIYRVVRYDNDNGSPKIQVIQGGANLADDQEPIPPIEHESTELTGILHLDATISMARGDPGTATHAFFITVGAQPGLDAGAARNPDMFGFAAFGRVTDGMDVVRMINLLEATAEVDDTYVAGQILDPPVMILSARRQ